MGIMPTCDAVAKAMQPEQDLEWTHGVQPDVVTSSSSPDAFVIREMQLQACSPMNIPYTDDNVAFTKANQVEPQTEVVKEIQLSPEVVTERQRKASTPEIISESVAENSASPNDEVVGGGVGGGGGGGGSPGGV